MGCTGHIPKEVNEGQISYEERESEFISLDNNKLLNEKAEFSICKIIIDKIIGNGFFCKIKNNNNSIYLVTCYHVITKTILDKYDKIKLIFNNYSIKFNLKEKRNILYDDKLDFMAIEIKNKDKIKVNAFEINDNCYNYEYDNIKYDKRGIIIPYMGEKNKVELTQGILNYSDNKRFMHNCNINPGNSGAPIILINNIKIIGIYTGYSKSTNRNIGLFFHNILKYIKNEPNKKEADESFNTNITYLNDYDSFEGEMPINMPRKKIEKQNMTDWWRLCRDFCNIYAFFSTGRKYSTFAKIRENIITNRNKTMVQDLSVVKDWLIVITESFWNDLKVFNDLNIAFNNKDSKLKIFKESQKIIAMIRKYLESLIRFSTKLTDIPVKVQKILYNFIKDNGYFPKNYLTTFQISRLDFNFYGGTKKIQNDQAGMILAFFIISEVTVQQILLHMKNNFVEFKKYPNIDKTAKYIGSIIHYLTRDTFINNPIKLNSLLPLMNYYRINHLYKKEVEFQDNNFDNIVLNDEDEYADFLIPENSITQFWNLNPEFVETFKNYVYSWACRLGKLIRLKYQKCDEN